MWDASKGQTALSYTGHTDAVRSVAWSPDGHALASAGGNGRLHLWDSQDGQQRQAMTGHTGLSRVLKAGKVPVDLIQKHINKWFYVALDLFGVDAS